MQPYMCEAWAAPNRSGILTEGRDKPWCSLCDLTLASTSDKVLIPCFLHRELDQLELTLPISAHLRLDGI